jgi:hypothetical protein
MNHLPYRVEEQLPGETTWRIVTSFATPERAETRRNELEQEHVASTFRVKKHVDFEAST